MADIMPGKPQSGAVRSIVLPSSPRLEKVHLHGLGVHIDFNGHIHAIKTLVVSQSPGPGVTLADLFLCLTHCPVLTEL
ncbi:hypothetical protein BD410DRAFT_791738, partial [Rickenella mellea]